MPDPTINASRLDVLLAARTQKRALLADANARYHQVREARAAVIGQKARLMMLAQHHGPVARHDADEQGKTLDAEHNRLTSLMQATEAETDGYAAEAAAASSLLKACTAFAIERGLPVAADLRREFAPTFAMGAV